MSRSFLIIIIVTLGIVVGGAFLMTKGSKPNPALDKFAQCLKEKNVVMYGAYWCPHCQRQKKLFGTSFQYINYVECTQDIKNCQEKNIKSYPTWIFEDDTRIEGEATFAQLAEKSSCPTP